jgi:hypothetical protein
MARSKGESLLTGSVDELVRFFDAHDMGAHWDEMPEVHFDVDIKRLINALLREKLAEAI